MSLSVLLPFSLLNNHSISNNPSNPSITSQWQVSPSIRENITSLLVQFLKLELDTMHWIPFHTCWKSGMKFTYFGVEKLDFFRIIDDVYLSFIYITFCWTSLKKKLTKEFLYSCWSIFPASVVNIITYRLAWVLFLFLWNDFR